jgi:hypothetical protein
LPVICTPGRRLPSTDYLVLTPGDRILTTDYQRQQSLFEHTLIDLDVLLQLLPDCGQLIARSI